MTADSHEKEYTVDVGVKSRTIHVDYLTRVEGEGSFFVRTEGHHVKEVRLKIFEPPRFFEAMLKGRSLFDAPDITARICGICPIAYQMSSVSAIENGLQITIPDYLHQLRRLMYCGEWIESHALHIYMLHAPDFLGFQDIVQMADRFPEEVQRGLKLKKAGNEIVRLLGGREIHPINVKVGGFYQLPTKKDLLTLKEKLLQAREEALATVFWVNGFTFPNFTKNYRCVSLLHPSEYPITQGAIGTSWDRPMPIDEYESHFEEEHVSWSTSLQSFNQQQGSYVTGPIARYNLNRTTFSPLVQQTIQSIRFESTCTNPFRSIIIRALEVLYACDEAIRLIDVYDAEKRPPSLAIHPLSTICCGATEAPRGLLYHRYRINDQGHIEESKIVPPTSQNQKTIEEDLFQFVQEHMDLPDDKLTFQCEQLIRNYDPCISCSTHFLKLERSHG